ncbi:MULTISPECIES: hypothetical protein [unclassified Streptomyces]|uniref:hypothetical protein n=1 Tax=unclassified Streptomyces TaxID=2593676 RepID=UPI003D93E38B
MTTSRRSFEHSAQTLERAGKGVLWRCAVADDQCRHSATAERRHPLQRKPLLLPAGDQLGLGRPVCGEFQDGMQPGGYSGHVHVWGTLSQRCD